MEHNKIEITNNSNINKSNKNNFENYCDKGLSGLANLGNTCFLNSCMQVLSHTYELNDFLNLETYKKKVKNNYDSALLIEWDELRKLLWS
jgi:ubiquitin C-terminal hydrolase